MRGRKAPNGGQIRGGIAGSWSHRRPTAPRRPRGELDVTVCAPRSGISAFLTLSWRCVSLPSFVPCNLVFVRLRSTLFLLLRSFLSLFSVPDGGFCPDSESKKRKKTSQLTARLLANNRQRRKRGPDRSIEGEFAYFFFRSILL